MMRPEGTRRIFEASGRSLRSAMSMTMRVAPVLFCLGLAACATVSTAGPTPTRAEVARALLDTMHCLDTDGLTLCHPPPRRAVFTRLRCVPAGEGDFAGRVLCLYAGHIERSDGSRSAIGSDCVYLARDAALRWRVAYFPDAEFCEA